MPLPQSYLLYVALKTRTLHEQYEKKVLGVPTVRYNKEFMLEDIRQRIAEYHMYFETLALKGMAPEEGSEGAELFLHSELTVLRDLERWLEQWTDDTGSAREEL